VVPVLLAPACVPTSGLKMAPRLGTDPHVAPCRRHGDRLDAGQDLLVADMAPVGANVDESPPALAPTESRPTVVDEDQASLPRVLAARVTDWTRGQR